MQSQRKAGVSDITELHRQALYLSDVRKFPANKPRGTSLYSVQCIYVYLEYCSDSCSSPSSVFDIIWHYKFTCLNRAAVWVTVAFLPAQSDLAFLRSPWRINKTHVLSLAPTTSQKNDATLRITTIRSLVHSPGARYVLMRWLLTFDLHIYQSVEEGRKRIKVLNRWYVSEHNISTERECVHVCGKAAV